MDPKATVEQIIDAMKDGDREEMKYLASELARWSGRGGFLPDGVKVDQFGRYVRIGRPFMSDVVVTF